MRRLQLKVVVRVVFFCLAVVGFATGQGVGAEPQQIGDLLITLTGASAPRVLAEGQDRLDPPPDRYWVVAEVSFLNIGNAPVCASFSGSLRAAQGLAARMSPQSEPSLSDVQPGEEVKTRFVFAVKRGVNPVELILETADYGRDCGDKLRPSAASSARMAIRGVASPQ
jgi:hypothetical protein